MKITIKHLCFFICILLLITSIPSCNNSSDQGDTTVSLTADTEETVRANEVETTETTESVGISGEENTEKIEDSTESTNKTTETTETTETQAQTNTTETTVETTQTETEIVLVEDLISFIDHTRGSKTFHDLKNEGDIAMSFTVPSGQLKKLYLNITDTYGYTPCSIEVNIYNLLSDYKTTVKSEPIYTEYITSTPKTYTINFEENFITEGSYLVTLSYVDPTTLDNGNASASNTQSDIYAKVAKDYYWYEINMPEEYVKYNMKSYINYNENRKYAFCGGIVVEHYEQKIVYITPEETTITENQGSENVENVAKIILIGGQSNATGCSVGNNLAKHVSGQKYLKYVNGFSNVKILYSSGANSGGKVNIQNQSTTFVNVKIGQGIYDTRFGPELGLASYLNEHYPNETFYIIKYAIGSTSLPGHWNPSNSAQSICLNQFNDLVGQGLAELESKG